MPARIDVQPQVRTFMESLGAQGTAWLDALPSLVERVYAAWSLTGGEPLPGGVGSWVARVGSPWGPAVLKVALPGPGFDDQLATLLAADGRGYVRVLAHDAGNGALLLEPLGPSREASPLPVDDLLEVTAATLVEAWSLPLATAPPGPHKAAGLLAILDDLAPLAPHHGAAIGQAQACARSRSAAADPGRQVVVHGDPHAGNLLQVLADRPGAPADHVLVDPDGFRCEREYDLGVAVRDHSADVLAADDAVALVRGRCARLAELTHTDPEAVWEWAFTERVTTGLCLARAGLADRSRPFLDAALRLLG